MGWFLNISTGSKIFLGFGIIILLQIIVMLSSSNITSLEEMQEKLYRKDIILMEELADILNDQNSARGASIILMGSKNNRDNEKFFQDIKQRFDEVEKSFQLLFTEFSDSPEILTKLQNLKTSNDEFKQYREALVNSLLGNNSEETAKILLTDRATSYQKSYEIADDIIKESKQKIHARLIQNAAEINKARYLFIFATLFSLLLAILIAWFLSRVIAYPLDKLSKMAARITEGDLRSEKIKIADRHDEVGKLASNFQAMINNLRELTTELIKMINALASSVSEISATTTQLAASASETATSVSETTSTMEEVKQTSLLASKKAKAVSEISNKSLEASHSGKTAAEEINKMTAQIHSEMEHIAESMVQLSEQSQAIGMIITTVDDLAQQSNLLSVNASIEAAKAGEQGKGFAVVAQEVKSLASQSKQATNQVRNILNDIQKATSVAVMATEQGNKNVEAREKTSAAAGESISILVNTVVETTHAATQIAATSHQQLIGMEQAALAMENIKQASAQNLTSAKQLEAEAQNLKEMGLKLKELISHYKI